MQADDTNFTRVTTNAASDGCSAWSPDGQWLSFNSDRDGNYEIYKMKVDGTAVTRLTNNPFSDTNPSWSPDGVSIVFQSDRDIVGILLYSMASDGNSVAQLLPGTDYARDADWGPRQETLVYTRKRAGDWNLFAFNLATEQETQLSADAT